MRNLDKMTPRYIRRYGFQAPTIIDVGVLTGTPFLYDAWPERKFILIDPLVESRVAVADLWGGLDYDFHLHALASEPGWIDLEVDPVRLSRTGRFRRSDGAAPVLDRRRVEAVRLDTITAGLDGPFGLKIDAEGQELDILHGAIDTLKRCEFVIAEVSIKKRFANGYRFSDVITFMADHGFEVLSFLSGLTRMPRMSDVLFIPADSDRFEMFQKDA